MKAGVYYHYVILREDLPSGVRHAQNTHASGESIRFPLPPDTHAVVLDIDDEEQLLELSRQLDRECINHKVIRETDAPYSGQAMSIGCEPTTDRTKIKRLTRHLRLAR